VAVGFAVGLAVGFAVGAVVGFAVGAVVGFAVGFAVANGAGVSSVGSCAGTVRCCEAGCGTIGVDGIADVDPPEQPASTDPATSPANAKTP
jgi:hypothetical protein